MAHVTQERKATLLAAAQTALAKWPAVKWTLRVRHHSTIVMTIASGTIDFESDAVFDPGSEHPPRLREGHAAVNHHRLDRDWRGDALAFLRAAKDALMVGNHDRSDLQSDYYDVGWYVDIQIGRWNKPYRFLAPAAPPAFVPADPAEVSQQIREALADAGIDKDDASVYVKRHAAGLAGNATVYVTVKRVDMRLISECSRIASPFERVQRDAAGNVIGDSNCWVDVRPDPDLPEPANDAEPVLTRDEQDTAERAEATPCPVCGSTEDHTGLVCIKRPEPAARFVQGASPEALVQRSREVAAEMAPALAAAASPVRARDAAPPFALVDATDADSAAVRGAILVLEGAVESGRMPPRAALEALAHMCFGMGRRESR